MSYLGPDSIHVSRCCPNTIRIPSWPRNSHCVERRSHQRLISAMGFPAIRLFLNLALNVREPSYLFLKYVNVIAADVLAPCVARTPAAMILTM